MSEKCQRCGDEGDDKRTLYMACFYAMNELKLPFDEIQLEGTVANKVGDKRISENFPIDVPVFGDPSTVTDKRNFFTLRVCKNCRSTWMSAIKDWFNNVERRESCNSGIFVRKNGATVEISEEEWKEQYGAKEPYQVTK